MEDSSIFIDLRINPIKSIDRIEKLEKFEKETDFQKVLYFFTGFNRSAAMFLCRSLQKI